MRRILATLAGATLAAGVVVTPVQALDNTADSPAAVHISAAAQTSHSTPEGHSDMTKTEKSIKQASEATVADFTSTPTLISMGVGLLVVAAMVVSSVRAAGREENQYH